MEPVCSSWCWTHLEMMVDAPRSWFRLIVKTVGLFGRFSDRAASCRWTASSCATSGTHERQRDAAQRRIEADEARSLEWTRVAG